MQKDLKFPEFIHDKKAKKLIEQLLSHTPEQRHGGSFASLKSHQWFDKFDWQSLILKDKNKLVPPHTPNDKSYYYRSKTDAQTGKKLSALIKEFDKEADRQR
jgi:hypothetical protein